MKKKLPIKGIIVKSFTTTLKGGRSFVDCTDHGYTEVNCNSEDPCPSCLDDCPFAVDLGEV